MLSFRRGGTGTSSGGTVWEACGGTTRAGFIIEQIVGLGRLGEPPRPFPTTFSIKT